MAKEIFTTLLENLPLIAQGTWMTIQTLLASASISLLCGTFIGILSSRQLNIKYVTQIFITGSFIIRAIPFYVQLLIIYFVLPEIIGLSFSAYTAGIITLGICSSAYVAQIIKAGINAIPLGQWYAAYVLGYNRRATLRYTILPQTLNTILPALINEIDHTLKSTSIISTIGVIELTRAGTNIVSRGGDPLAVYLSIATIYVCLSGIFNYLGTIIEERLNYAKH